MKIPRPAPEEYAEYFGRYIAHVPEDDVLPALERQPGEMAAALASVPADRESFRYAPDKWTIREVVGHVIDCERVFGYRALAIARGERASLPGFEENEYAKASGHDARTLASLVEELAALRKSHVAMFRHLDEEARARIGVANGQPVSARAIAYILVGHARHHMAVLADKYGVR